MNESDKHYRCVLMEAEGHLGATQKPYLGVNARKTTSSHLELLRRPLFVEKRKNMGPLISPTHFLP